VVGFGLSRRLADLVGCGVRPRPAVPGWVRSGGRLLIRHLRDLVVAARAELGQAIVSVRTDSESANIEGHHICGVVAPAVEAEIHFVDSVALGQHDNIYQRHFRVVRTTPVGLLASIGLPSAPNT
jgi:hypothetical protein